MIAITAVTMCILFIMVDLEQPLGILHILPKPIGMMNFPASLLTWDVMVLSGYLLINALLVLYIPI